MFEWWHWLVLGCFLLVLDLLFINVYYLIWFGFSSLVIGAIVFVFASLSLTVQILLWALVSILLLVQWLVWLKPRAKGRQLEKARQELPGQAGVVVKFHSGAGVLRLQRPIGGKDIWDFSSTKNYLPGDRVVIDSITEEGKILTKN